MILQHSPLACDRKGKEEEVLKLPCLDNWNVGWGVVWGRKLQYPKWAGTPVQWSALLCAMPLSLPLCLFCTHATRQANPNPLLA